MKGRKPEGRVGKMVYMPPESWKAVDSRKTGKGDTRGKVIERGLSLASRSPFIAKKEAEGAARLVDDYADNQKRIRSLQPKVSSQEAHEQARRQNQEASDSFVEYETRQKWTPTPDIEP